MTRKFLIVHHSSYRDSINLIHTYRLKSLYHSYTPSHAQSTLPPRLTPPFKQPRRPFVANGSDIFLHYPSSFLHYPTSLPCIAPSPSPLRILNLKAEGGWGIELRSEEHQGRVRIQRIHISMLLLGVSAMVSVFLTASHIMEEDAHGIPQVPVPNALQHG